MGLSPELTAPPPLPPGGAGAGAADTPPPPGGACAGFAAIAVDPKLLELEAAAVAAARLHRQAESELTAQIRELQHTVLLLEEQVAQTVSSSPAPGGDATAEELRGKAQELSRKRAESLRAASAAGLAEFGATVAKQIQALSRFAVPEACGREDKLFISGFVRSSRLHRALLPLSSLRSIFASALSPRRRVDLATKTHVAFALEPPLLGAIWRLQKGLGCTMFSAPSTLELRVAMVEFGLDFDAGVHRFALRPPAGHDREKATLAYVEAWRDDMVAAKIRQFYCVRDEGLVMPRLPAQWPNGGQVEDMPCVVWIFVPQEKKNCAGGPAL